MMMEVEMGGGGSRGEQSVVDEKRRVADPNVAKREVRAKGEVWS